MKKESSESWRYGDTWYMWR